jgi:uncharacterized RDD family membrane protein YckC
MSMNSRERFVFVGFWRRLLAYLIDLSPGWAFVPLTRGIMVWSFQQRTILPYAAWSTVWAMVWLWLVVRFGATPGKFAIRARIVDRNGVFLSCGRAFLRMMPGWLYSVNLLLHMWTAIGKYPEGAPCSTFHEVALLLREYGNPLYPHLLLILGLFIYLDAGTILFNREKRAIHDFIAGSYVITKDSYQEVAEQLAGAARS